MNRDLPASTKPDYPEHQRQRLITSMIPITWPLQPPFVSDIYVLLDRLVAEENAKQAGRLTGTETVVVEQSPVKTTEVVQEPQVKVVERKRKKKS